jgi:hypothetical protein
MQLHIQWFVVLYWNSRLAFVHSHSTGVEYALLHTNEYIYIYTASGFSCIWGSLRFVLIYSEYRITLSSIDHICSNLLHCTLALEYAHTIIIIYSPSVRHRRSVEVI